MPSTLTDFSTWLRKDTHGNTIQQVKDDRMSMSVDHRKYIANTTQRKFDGWGFTPSGKCLLPADVQDDEIEIDYESEDYIF